MGKDIISHVCRRLAPPSLLSMEHIAKFDIVRSWELFKLMAGFELEPENQMFPPRGLPDDLPIFVDTEYTNTPSWLNTYELEKVAAALPPEHLVNNYTLLTLIGAMRTLDLWCNDHDPGSTAILVFFFHG